MGPRAVVAGDAMPYPIVMKKTALTLISAVILAAPAFAAPMAPAAAKGAIPRAPELPQWDPKTESLGSWMNLTFTDEAGDGHEVWCHWQDCGRRKKSGTSNLYVFKRNDTHPIGPKKVPAVHVFDTQVSPYVLDLKSGNVVKPGTPSFSSTPRYPHGLWATGSMLLVMPPTKMAPDTAPQKLADRAKPPAKEPAKQPAKEPAKQPAKEPAKEPAKQPAPTAPKPDDEAARRKAEADRKAAEDKAKADQEAAARKAAEDKAKADQEAARRKAEEDAKIALAEPLTNLEIAVIASSMTTAGYHDFTKGYGQLLKEREKDRANWNAVVGAMRADVMKHVLVYVDPKWTPKNPKAPKVWDRFDDIEKTYLNVRLIEISSAAAESFKAQLAEAQKALDKGDAKKADRVIEAYRPMIKADMNLYAGRVNTKLSAKEQLEKMQRALAGLAGVTDIDKMKKVWEDVYSGKGSDGKVNGDGRGPANDVPTDPNQKKGETPDTSKTKLEKTKTLTPPPLGKDPGGETKDKGFDMDSFKEYATIGLMAALLGLIASTLSGSILFIAGAVLVGAAMGWLYNEANR